MDKKKKNLKVKDKAMRWQIDKKVLRVYLPSGDDTRVKVTFMGDYFTPQEFTSLLMAVLESYTEGLLQTNSRKDVHEHWNNVFGIFLNKILSEKEIYENSDKHKEAKKIIDSTLGQPETEEVKSSTEDNRLAAYLLARDIMMETGMAEDVVDALLNKRLGLNMPKLGGEGVVQ